jgi:META domain
VVQSSLVGHRFRLTTITENDRPVPIVDGTEPTLSFTSDRLEAETGCNRLWGDYEVDVEGRFLSGEIRQTLIGCGMERLYSRTGYGGHWPITRQSSWTEILSRFAAPLWSLSALGRAKRRLFLYSISSVVSPLQRKRS